MPYFSYTQIQLGPIILQTWGLFLGLSFLIGYLIALKQAQKYNIEQKKIVWLIFFIFLASILGARLAYVLQYNVDLSRFFYIWEGGLAFYGGFLGALIVGWIYIKKTKLNFWQIADILVPAIVLGIFISRIGCSLINDHQGAITDLPWAIQWPDRTFRHPVAEYLALNGLIMFFVLSFLKGKFTKGESASGGKTGQLFIVFVIWYSTVRFLLDFFRANDPYYWGLTMSQWISLFVLIYVIILIWQKHGTVFQLRKLFKS